MIKTDKLIIDTIIIDDLDTVFLWSSPEFRGDYQEFKFSSKEMLRKEIENGELCTDKFQMLMVRSPEREPMGIIYINFTDYGYVRLGLVMHGGMRRKGYGAHAAKTIVKHIFDNYPVVRIEADTSVHNIPAQKTLESAGFEREGIKRKCCFDHGKHHDYALYSIIREF